MGLFVRHGDFGATLGSLGALVKGVDRMGVFVRVFEREFEGNAKTEQVFDSSGFL